MYEPPRDRQDAEHLRQYLSQVRQELATRLRPDAVAETDRRDAFQRIAPQTEAGLYLVPKVIE